MAAITELPFFFQCEGQDVLGIVATPAQSANVGVLIVVGGPQYRIGSHRQFVHLARHVAESGLPCMRFDYRGMGDSDGDMRTFEVVEHDLRAAVDAFFDNCPELQRVVLWGLCDGASAICFYAAGDARVAGVVLANPWTRTPQGYARTQLRHYYWRRLLERGFWKKVMRGGVDFGASAKSIFQAIRTMRHAVSAQRSPSAREPLPLPDRMARGLADFSGRVLVILSGNDYTANEFSDIAAASAAWAAVLKRACTERLTDADHTFSSRAWKERAAEITVAWCNELASEMAKQANNNVPFADPDQSRRVWHVETP